MANQGGGKTDPWNQQGPADDGASSEYMDVFGLDPNKKNPTAPSSSGDILGILFKLFGNSPAPTSPSSYGHPDPSQPQQPGRQGSPVDWQDILRNLQSLSGQGGAQQGATPGAFGANGPGLNTRVNPNDFANFLPGYASMGPVDYSALFNLAGQDPLAALAAQGGARGGAGGGGGAGGQGGAVGAAQNLLGGYFGGGNPAIDPAIKAQIDALQGASASQYGAFPGMIGGGQDPIMALILGELGGNASLSSSFGGGFGGGGGGGAYAMPNVDISLKGISPEAQALIDSQTKARTGALDLSRKSTSGQALADLFGRGVERSSIALDKMGRLQYGHEQALQEALAAGSEQTLGAMLADQQARTELGKSQLAAAAQAASAAASSAGSGFAAQAQMAGQRLGLLGDIFGSRAGALSSAFGSQQAANTGFAGILGDVGLGQLDALGQRASTATNLIDSQNSLRAAFNNAAQSRASANDVARIGQQTALANLPFQNQLAASQFQQSEAARLQQGILALLGIDLDRYLGDTAANAQVSSARLGRPSEPSWLDRLLGIGGTLGAAYLGRG